MDLDYIFFINSVLLGIGLAMDAFTVSLANGLNYPDMKKGKMCFIAGVFAFFQAIMPMLGWICVHTIVVYFSFVSKIVPYISLVLLSSLGGKMIFDGIKKKEDKSTKDVRIATILLQGIATSIDALSVGFTIAEYEWQSAIICSIIIAAVTFIICLPGIFVGKRFGTRLSSKATILGGILLIIIGIEIFIKGII